MRLDKLTTRFQQALSDAQSAAVGNDNPYIEPVHVLGALLAAEDGGARSLLSRAGANIPRLTQALKDAVGRLPQVQGNAGQIQLGRDTLALLNLADKDAR